MNIHKNVKLGKNCKVMEGATIGLASRDYLNRPEDDWPATTIGDSSVVRRGTIIYCDVAIGEGFQTGHNVLIREKTQIGDNVLIGTNTVIDGETSIGSNVSIQSNVYIPLKVVIEDKVFIGPNAVLANDRYPVRTKEELKGPVLRKGVSIGANATILPDIEIGEGAMVAAGSVVTKNIPPWSLAVGAPAIIRELPENLKTLNLIGD